MKEENKEWTDYYYHEIQEKIRKALRKELDIYICHKCSFNAPCLFIDFVGAEPMACILGNPQNEPEWRTP